MNCRKVSNLLSAYMDGELPGVEQLLIRDHLKTCEQCQDDYDSLLFTKRLLCGLRVKEPADQLEARIHGAIAEERGRPGCGQGGQPFWDRLRAWWEVQAYPRKLRLSVALAGFAVLYAGVTVAAYSVRSPEEGTLQTVRPALARTVMPSSGGYFRPIYSGPVQTVIPTLHDPAFNPPAQTGAPVFVPVSADEAVGHSR